MNIKGAGNSNLSLKTGNETAGAKALAPTAYLPSRDGDLDPRSYKHRSEHQYHLNLKEQKDLEMLQVDLFAKCI